MTKRTQGDKVISYVYAVAKNFSRLDVIFDHMDAQKYVILTNENVFIVDYSIYKPLSKEDNFGAAFNMAVNLV